MTATALARDLGVTQSNVSMVLTGRRPGTKHLPRIAEILGVRLEWLASGEEPMVAPSVCPRCGADLSAAAATAPSTQEA